MPTNFTEQEVRELMILARMFPKRNIGELIAEHSQSIPSEVTEISRP